MNMTNLKGAAAAVLVVLTAGCSSGVEAPAPPPTASPPPAATGLSSAVDQLGAGFALAFRAGPFTVPREPVAGDIVAVSATRDPINY